MARTGATPGTAFTGPLFFFTPAGDEVASVAYDADEGLVFESEGFANGQIVKRLVTNVDASAGGAAQTQDIGSVPAGSLLLGVVARVVTPFDSAGVTTLEVGIVGNIDKYIDTVDFDPSVALTQRCSIGGTTNDQKTYEYFVADTTLIATWTNQVAATAGLVEVTVLYV